MSVHCGKNSLFLRKFMIDLRLENDTFFEPNVEKIEVGRF
jgi:hypothetical protein